jgi:hypothetical protein
MTKQNTTINISHELNHAKTSFINDLERISKYAAIAEQVSKISSEIQLPENSIEFFFGFGIHNSPTNAKEHDEVIQQEVLENYYEYSTRYAVIVMITTCEMYLIRLLWIAKICDWIKNNKSMSGQQFYDLGAEARKEARYTSVPKLVEKISKEIGEEIYFDDLPIFNSIYNARNCLAHRRGEISKEDIDENGDFKLLWKTLQLTVDGAPQEQIRGLYVEAGNQVGFRFIVSEKKLSAGEKLVLTAQDCQNIAFTLAGFSANMTKAIENAARKIIVPGSFASQ